MKLNEALNILKENGYIVRESAMNTTVLKKSGHGSFGGNSSSSKSYWDYAPKIKDKIIQEMFKKLFFGIESNNRYNDMIHDMDLVKYIVKRGCEMRDDINEYCEDLRDSGVQREIATQKIARKIKAYLMDIKRKGDETYPDKFKERVIDDMLTEMTWQFVKKYFT